MFPQTHEREDEADGWNVSTCLPLAQAEHLLDWLENHGCRDREVLLGPEGVTVRWRSDAVPAACREGLPTPVAR